MNELMVDNADMIDIDFEDVSMDMGNILNSSGIVSLQRKDMVIILARGVIIGIRTIMLSQVEIWVQLS